MIVITFANLGNDVKVTTDGNMCMCNYDNMPELEKLLKLNNSLLRKEETRYKEAYQWCKVHSAQYFKNGRNENFAF